MMGQVDAEEGMAGPPATGFTGGPATGYAEPSGTGFAGGPMWRQEPTADADFSSADLVSVEKRSHSYTGPLLCYLLGHVEGATV